MRTTTVKTTATTRTRVGYSHQSQDKRVFGSVPLSMHLKCGLHSGFRLCDIIWFVTGWHLLLWLKQKNKPTLEFHGPNGYVVKAWDNIYLADKYSFWRDRDEVHYMECPMCKLFQPKPIKVKPCPPGSHGE